MASRNLQGSSSNGFGFFRIIFEENLERKMLELPKKFVRLYEESLSSKVVLKPPYGSKWRIRLAKRDGKVWLQQGWPEFAQRYALGFGHLLFFRYEGDSQFQLSICDMSTCEIQPPIPTHLVERDVNESKKCETEVDHDSVQIFDTSSGEEDLTPFSPPHKRMRPCPSGRGMKTAYGDKPAIRRGRKPKVHIRTRSQTRTEEDKTLGSGSSDDEFGIHPLGQAEETKSQYPQGKGYAEKGKSRELKSEDLRPIRRRAQFPFSDSMAFEAANKFSSKKPFCLAIVTSTYAVRLPSEFAKRHMEQKAQTVRLEVGNSSWPVQFTNRKSGSFPCRGYSKFLKANSLRRGDVCIYELNKGKYQREVVLEVTIFRSSTS